MTKPLPKNWYPFLRKFVDLQKEAHDMGLHGTAQVINRAMRVAGWEQAGEVGRLDELADRTYEKRHYP